VRVEDLRHEVVDGEVGRLGAAARLDSRLDHRREEAPVRPDDVGEHDRETGERGEQREGIYSIQRLVSPRDEWIDLSESEFREAVARTRQALLDNGKTDSAQDVKEPSGPVVRRVRPPTRGLLLIYPLDPRWPGAQLETDLPVAGIAVSFPGSSRGIDAAVEYVVNNVYWRQEYGGDA